MAEYFVRPDTSHNTTRDGLTYATAWGGWSEITWGTKFTGGDTLYVCGTFTSGSTLSVGAHNATSGNPAIISGGYASAPGSITFTGSVFLNLGRSHTTISDLTITAATSNCIFISGISIGVTIRRCTFNNGTGAAGISLSGGNTYSYTDLTIDGNTFIGGSGYAGGSAISWLVVANLTPVCSINRMSITNNTFTGCSSTRSVIHLRIEDGAHADTKMADIVIVGNEFLNCVGLAIEPYGPSVYGRNTGIKILNNTIRNQQPVGILGGGMSVSGFGPSLTGDFGDNIIAYNKGYVVNGPSGMVNIFYGTYLVYENYGEDITSHTIDGNGVLFDFGCINSVAYRNHFRRVTGNASTENSGCGIMVLSSTGVVAYGNIIEGCKIGIYVGNKGLGQSSNIYNNTFKDCSYAGVLTLSTADMASNLVRNNIFTGPSSIPSVMVQGGTLTSESTNCFYGFGAPTGHTLSPTSITTDPQLDERHGCASSTVKGKGTFIDAKSDFYNRLFKNPPIIGAVEEVTNDLYRTLRGI